MQNELLVASGNYTCICSENYMYNKTVVDWDLNNVCFVGPLDTNVAITFGVWQLFCLLVQQIMYCSRNQLITGFYKLVMRELRCRKYIKKIIKPFKFVC